MEHREPLRATVELLDSRGPEANAVRLRPTSSGWTRCSLLLDEPDRLTQWQARVVESFAATYPGSEPAGLARAAAGSVLDWYAYVPGFLVGSMFHLARRVPEATPELTAIRTDPAEHWVDGTALLGTRFWCLPGDPDAGHRDATVVGTEGELAGVARAQVRSHADRFLAAYRPLGRLPRRALLGAFFDALDTAAWEVEGLATARSCVRSARTLLPGRTREFADASRMYALTDTLGRVHPAQRRVGCCESYRITQSCFGCPRTTDAERAEQAADWPDPVQLTTDLSED